MSERSKRLKSVVEVEKDWSSSEENDSPLLPSAKTGLRKIGLRPTNNDIDNNKDQREASTDSYR